MKATDAFMIVRRLADGWIFWGGHLGWTTVHMLGHKYGKETNANRAMKRNAGKDSFDGAQVKPACVAVEDWAADLPPAYETRTVSLANQAGPCRICEQATLFHEVDGPHAFTYNCGQH